MRQRILTAIVFVGIMLLGIFGGAYSFLGLVSLILFISLLEFFQMTLPKSASSYLQQKWLGIVLSMAPVLYLVIQYILLRDGQALNFDYSLLSILIVLSYAIYLIGLRLFSIESMSRLFFGLIYLGIPYFLLILIGFWEGTYQPWYFAGILVMVWLNDTGAYFLGTWFGKRPLAPQLSPKKTWEGMVGGIIFTIITSQILAHYLDFLSARHWLFLGFICSFGIVGDLLESKLKRQYGVKDSGKILPGHGGLLDRFDAFIFVIPLVFLYLHLFVK